MYIVDKTAYYGLGTFWRWCFGARDWRNW